MRYFWTKISGDMQMAAELKAMNKARHVEMDVPEYEEREGHDGRAVRVQVGVRRMPVRTRVLSRRDVHQLAMGGRGTRLG